MNLITGILICLTIIGFGLIIFAFFIKSGHSSMDSEFNNIENIIETLNKSVSEADNYMDEMSKLSEVIFKEMEEKYQELLFLYQMLDDKQASIKSTDKIDVQSKPEAETKNNHTYNNPKLKEINKLKSQGLSYAEIAKQLNMGQGEVKLIAELGKAR